MKLIISDLDGTLLTEDKRVGKESIEGIQKLTRKGIPFVIATGRSFASCNMIRKQIGVDIYMVCNNGASIYSPRQELLSANYISREHVMDIVNCLNRYRVDYRGFFESKCFMPSYLKEDILQEPCHEMHIFEEEVPQDLEKFLIMNGEEGVLRKIQKELEDSLGEHITVCMSGMDCLDITGKNCSKAAGIQVVADRLDIPLEDAIAFGDSENDFSMLESVGRPVVMKNSYASRKRDYERTDFSNDEDGVIRHLKKHYSW